EVFAKGGEGGIELAKKVIKTIEEKPSQFHVLYDENLSIPEKIETLVKEIYGGDGIIIEKKAKLAIDLIESLGQDKKPICVAKTQYSLSDDPMLLGRPEGFKITVRDVKLCAGAGFIVVYTGDIMIMPGLPKVPSAEKIDIMPNGDIVGIF
ncbi:MAG: formate--tetrahydrofolate ligase, partial [Clostridia bacterium]|nr:formate--tetrahydrofolate ligase [Clostridia bacterium]